MRGEISGINIELLNCEIKESPENDGAFGELNGNKFVTFRIKIPGIF